MSDATGTRTAPQALVWCIAALSLTPFLLNLSHFRELFYFGDEWDLLSQIADVGLLRWSVLPFAENVVPLFKLLWGGAVMVFSGSYLSMLVLLWMTHFAITATLGSILRRLGFSTFIAVSAMLTLGLAWTNIESLAWSVQWSPMLAMLFFVLSWRVLVEILHEDQWSRAVISKLILYGFLLLAGALCFSRGVISGLVLGGYALLGSRGRTVPTIRRRAVTISFVLPFLVGLLIYIPSMPLGSTQRYSTDGHLAAIAAFASQCFLHNPLFQIASWDALRVGLSAALVFGMFKAVVIATGFADAGGSRQQVAFLGALVMFDVLNCCLLGIGRWDTGIQASVSSRYQYGSIVCLAPFLGVFMQRIALSARTGRIDKITAACLLFAWCALLTYRWPAEMKTWSVWRGSAVRAALAASPPAPQERFARATLGASRAAELKARYNLH